MRPSWKIDLDAIRGNAAAIAAEVAPAALCAVVKADGYGHGDVPVARAALAGGATWLAVALLEEGERLREAGIDAPILLLSEPASSDAARVISSRLTPTVYTGRCLEAIAAAAMPPTSPKARIQYLKLISSPPWRSAGDVAGRGR